jgi:hypothetical protein
MAQIYVVCSHVEVEIDNWSSKVLKAFTSESDAQAFAEELRALVWKDYKETIDVETIELIGD